MSTVKSRKPNGKILENPNVVEFPDRSFRESKWYKSHLATRRAVEEVEACLDTNDMAELMFAVAELQELAAELAAMPIPDAA